MRAKVTSWADGGPAELFEDEHGVQWARYADAADGTIAVSVCDGDGNQTGEGAGVFRWQPGTTDEGDIYAADEGDTYGVNCRDEFVVRSGEWTDAEVGCPE